MFDIVNFTTCGKPKMPVGNIKNLSAVLEYTGFTKTTFVVLKQSMKVDRTGFMKFWNDKVLKVFRMSFLRVTDPCVHVTFTGQNTFGIIALRIERKRAE